MDTTLSWWAAFATVAVLVGYEASLALAQRRRPDRMARTAHANLREDWFVAVSNQKGSEILAVTRSLVSPAMLFLTAEPARTLYSRARA